MTRLRLLDLFAGAGGSAVGYARAGFEVVGVDLVASPNYPFAFHQADALTFPLEGFDAIHASPPCQLFIRSGMFDKSEYVDLLTPMRERLIDLSTPWVIENVPGAPMRPDLILCGSQFGLELQRHRWFEMNWTVPPWVPPCDHSRPAVGVYGHPRGKARFGRGTFADWKRAMGIEWMTSDELAQAIPPAYTEFIGAQLLAHLGGKHHDHNAWLIRYHDDDANNYGVPTSVEHRLTRVDRQPDKRRRNDD